MLLDDDIMRQLRATFKVEAAEHLQAMNRILLALEQKPGADERTQLLEEIFREAHSLKGASGAADIQDAEAVGHRLESVLGSVKAGDVELSADLCDVLYESIDAVGLIVEAALDERAHGVDLGGLFERLDAAKEGKVLPRKATPAALETVKPGVEPTAGVAVAAEAKAAHPAQPDSSASASPSAEQGAPEVAVPAQTKAAKVEERKGKAGAGDSLEETVRVATNKLDTLMTQAGELLVAGLKIDQRLQEVQEVDRSIEDWNREWLKVRATFGHLLQNGEQEELRPMVRFLDLNQQKLKALATRVNALWRDFSRDALHLARVTGDLGEEVMKVRMLPVATVFDTLPRLVRDVARERGKEVDLQIEGGETELDRKVLEEIKDPLMHLLRNGVDHGIESPEERVKAGKPQRGTIKVSAFQKGNNIVIEVQDDGAGIDVEKVKKAALKSGLIDSEALLTINDDEARRLIFASGLSTSSAVTDISGRGVGMDVVRKNVEALHGQVDLESVLSRGTRFTLSLPLTLATTQELLVQVGEQTFGLPISAVERIQRIQPQDISNVEGKDAIKVDEEPVSLVRLADVLELPMREEEVKSDQRIPVVLLGSGKRRIAFLVDAVVGQQESVVKSLGRQLSRVRNVTGATILGTGKVIMTLNPVDLMASVRSAQGKSINATRAGQAKAKDVKRPVVLVVDDSLTTRTLEKNILETAGYQVKVATDGVEALSILQSDGCNLVVSDVLMPRMNGLQLTLTIKGDPKLRDIPVVLVTSADSRDDKERGIEAGADAYVVKSNFDQANLLQTVEQLI